MPDSGTAENVAPPSVEMETGAAAGFDTEPPSSANSSVCPPATTVAAAHERSLRLLTRSHVAPRSVLMRAQDSVTVTAILSKVGVAVTDVIERNVLSVSTLRKEPAGRFSRWKSPLLMSAIHSSLFTVVTSTCDASLLSRMCVQAAALLERAVLVPLLMSVFLSSQKRSDDDT
jgi:hypothetical protein